MANLDKEWYRARGMREICPSSQFRCEPKRQWHHQLYVSQIKNLRIILDDEWSSHIATPNPPTSSINSTSKIHLESIGFYLDPRPLSLAKEP